MTSNLPERQNATLAPLGGQAALWADPRQLLDFDEASLRRLAAEVGHEAGGVLAQVRRAVGLVAWAAWYRMTEKDYRSFAEGLAGDLDIEAETLRNWRRAVVRTDKLPVPGVAGLRAGEAAKGRKAAGQPTGALSPTAPSGVIPAASTEASAKSSEGGEQDGETRPAPEWKTPSGKSSEGGGKLRQEAVLDSGTLGATPPPSDPSDPEEIIEREIGGTMIRGPRKFIDQCKFIQLATPSDRQLTARVFAAMREVDPTDAGPVTTPEEATFLRQWAQRTLDAWKAKNGVAPYTGDGGGTSTRRAAEAKRRQGKRPPPVSSVLSVGLGRGKRHADDCSCLSCVPPKAAAK